MSEPLSFWDDLSVADQLREREELPFVPFKQLHTTADLASGRTYSEWNFSCPLLTPEGRCADYENRPHACRAYEPRSDALCVHFQGAEGTGEGL